MSGLRIFTQGDKICFQVRVQPRASRQEIIGVQSEALKIRLTAPPIDDLANQQLVDFLRCFFNLRRGRVILLSGHRSRTKTVSVSGISRQELEERLAQYLV